MTCTVMVRQMSDMPWELYGVMTEQELKREMLNIQALGLYVKVDRKGRLG